MHALRLLQVGRGDAEADIRVNTDNAQINIGLDEINIRDPSWADLPSKGIVRISIDRSNEGKIKPYFISLDDSENLIHQIQNKAPNHFIVPFFSNRKTSGYREDVGINHTLLIDGDMSHLAAKLSRLGNPGFSYYKRYKDTCEEILGFLVTAIPSKNGQLPGIYLDGDNTLPITQMGEGIPHIVTLLADLALSSGKLFLIEEPENDLHPQALKALLDLILESSQKNQFVISTHSNIVVRHLASAENSKLYNVTSEVGSMPPKAIIREVERTVDARMRILRDLGYSFSDFDLWEGWLILEESSAERIIRDYLIPWFAPKLTRIRTISAGGISKVEPTFEDFNRLVRFTHLEEVYRNMAWVRVDGDEPGNQIIKQLQETYSSWSLDKFRCFNKEQFEHYYPFEFSSEITDVLSIPTKKDKREAKKKLGDKVRAWLDEDEHRGRKALEESAAEVISDLKTIEKQLIKK